MSSSDDPWDTVAAARDGYRTIDAELPRLRVLHGDLETLYDALVRNKPEQASVSAVLDSVDRLGGNSDDRRAALGFLTDRVLDDDRTVTETFRTGRAVTSEADAVASALDSFVGGGSWSSVHSEIAAVVQPGQGPMAIDTTTLDQLVTLFGLAIEAGLAAREAHVDALTDALASAYAGTDGAFPDLDEQPIALLPVRLETRFVDTTRPSQAQRVLPGPIGAGQLGGEEDLTDLLIRVYPDQIHADSHEAALTDDEVLWGQNFWATLWYARHPDPTVVPDDPSAQYLQDRLPNQRLRELVAGIDAAKFSTAHAKRYDELKERAWKQLLDRFGRERAAYVVHALEPADEAAARDLLRRPPTAADLLAETDGGEDDADEETSSPSDAQPRVEVDENVRLGTNRSTTVAGDGVLGRDIFGDNGTTLGDRLQEGTHIVEGVQDDIDSGTFDPVPDLPTKVPGISFPQVPRKPVSWTQQPRAALLPDRWIAVAEWTDPQGKTQRTAVAGDPIREPLPVGPSPESVAAEELDSEQSDSPAPEGTEWMVDFDEAETVGMGLRLKLTGLAGFDPYRGFDRLTVVGVKASMDDQETPDALEALLDAHHYTDGLALLEQGTPTNNHDRSSGHTRADDPIETMHVECVPPLVETGDRTDGDLLSRALAIDSEEDHVFANVENAGGTQQRDARHMNSALWPATLGYYFQDLLIDTKFTTNESLWNGSSGPLTGKRRRAALDEPMLWLDAYRRHFVRYVRGRGPFPAMQVGKQPYGILPARAIETDRDITIVDQDLVGGLERGELSVAELDRRGTPLGDLVDSGVSPRTLLNGGATPEQLLQAGADPKAMLADGMAPKRLLDASGVAPSALTDDGIGLLATSRVTKGRLAAAGVPVEELQQRGTTVRSLVRGEVSDRQLAEAGVTTEAIAEVVLPRQARSLGITPAALQRAGVTPGALLRGELTEQQVENLGLTTRAVADAILPRELRELGVTPKKLEDAEISPRDLLNGTVSPDDLQQVGITTETLAQALLPQELIDFGITPEKLGASVDVADLFNGTVDVTDLEAAGLNTRNLADALLPQSFRDAGITPDSLASAGITPDAVLNGAVTPEDIVEAGVTPDALAAAGVLPESMADVGEAFGDLLQAGLEPMELLEQGLSPEALLDAGVTPQLLVDAGLAPKQLVDAGMDVVELATSGTVPVADLLQAGASPAQLARAGAIVSDLSGGEIPAGELVKAGFTAVDVIQSGADALGVAQAGARPTHLREAGVDAGTLREAGKAAGSLRIAGYTAAELLESGYTAEELLNGGFSPEELTAAGVSPEAVQGAGRAVDELLAAGFVPADLRSRGYDAEQLLDAGVDAATLVAAGYTAGELTDAGVPTDRLAATGMDVESLRAAGADVGSLSKAGVDAGTLKDVGASAEQLLDEGFGPQELLDAGFESVELEIAGVDVDALAEDVLTGAADTDDVADSVVDGLQYAATVLEDPEQAERDLYSFSFDPALPTLPSAPETPPADASSDQDHGETDGGVATGIPVVRPLSVDDRLPARLEKRVCGFGSFWSEAAETLPFAGDTDEDALLNALKREGLSADIRQRTMAYEGDPDHKDTDGVAGAVCRYFLREQQTAVRQVLEASSATDLDPRIASIYPTDATREDVESMLDGVESNYLHYFYNWHFRQQRAGIIEPHDIVDADIGQFVDVLLGSSITDLERLSDVVFTSHFDVDPAMLGIDQEVWSGLDYGQRRARLVAAIESADDPLGLARSIAATGEGAGAKKLRQLGENQRDFRDSGVLRSLLRLLWQYGTIQEYVSARRRLGLAYDDLPEAWPDPGYYRGDEQSPIETLSDPVPKALRWHPNVDSDTDDYSYEHVLRVAAANYGSSTSIDPRLSEYTDSLRYLGGVDPADLATLARETLDLCSHRIDAWWTSLATKRLFELREAQGTYDSEAGFDVETWSGGASDLPRATLDPALLSSVQTGSGADGTAIADRAAATGRSGESIVDDVAGGIDGTATSQTADATTDRIAETTSADQSDDTQTSEKADPATVDVGPFDPARIANLDLNLSTGQTDDDASSDGGIGPLGTGFDVDTTGSGSESSTQRGPIDLDALTDAGNVATRTEIDDPSTLHDRVQADPGLYVGGYGFVENLSADREGETDPEYVHAPSEQHATTAALLRSGYEAHDADEGENPMAVDLSAGRVRDGLRLIRGIRRGQSLGELLGYRFERRLHEETVLEGGDLMQYADVFRKAFPAKRGKLTRPDETDTEGKAERDEELATRDVVDGYQLVKHWDEYPFGYGTELPDAGVADGDYAEIDAVVDELAATIDAAGDLLTAEGVHQLGQGNFEGAGGSVGALARGEPLPDPAVARTPRSETGVTHRQCVLFGETTAESETTPRSQAEPTLAAWVETLLPDHADVECTATYRWTETTTDPTTGTDQEIDHAEPTSATLADLDLGPLDVLLLFGADREAARSELQQRLVFELLRERPTDPAVPADARVELTLKETATDDAIPMADLLELVRSIRELVQAARPATAEDLAHPTDQQGDGYDAATADTLDSRANAAQDQLFSTASAIDERLAVLDADHTVGDGIDGIPTPPATTADGGSPLDGSWEGIGGGAGVPTPTSPALDIPFAVDRPTLTEQVSDLVDAVETVDTDVPTSTAESIASSIAPDAIRTELSALVDTLPAGPTSPDGVAADVTVRSHDSAAITGTLGTPVSVPGPGDGSDTDGGDGDDGSDAGEGSDTDAGGSDTDGSGSDDGAPSSSGPITWQPPGSSLATSIPASQGSTVSGSETIDRSSMETYDTAWYAGNLDSIDVSGGLLGVGGDSSDAGESGDGTDAGDEPDADTGESSEPTIDWSTATATIRVWGTDGLGWFERTTTTTPDRNGRFAVEVDLSTVDAGTPFTVVAEVDDTVVYSATGRVVAEDVVTTAQQTLEEDCPNLQQLLWLRARQSLFSDAAGPLQGLDLAVGALQWGDLQAERDAADPASSTVTAADLDTIDDLLAVEGYDPSSLAATVDEVVAPISTLGLDQILDVTGTGGPSEVSYWYGPTPALGDVRARLTRTLDNPTFYNEGVAPWLLSYHHDSVAVLDDMSGGETTAAYLDAFLSGPPWVLSYLDDELAEPALLVRELTAWLYRPDEVESTAGLATRLSTLASVVTDLPALATLFEGLPTGSADSHLAAFKIHLQGLASTIDTHIPSITDPASATSTFDTTAATAASALESDAATTTATLSPLVDSDADVAVRNLVLERLREPMTVAASYGVFGGTPTSADGGQPDDEAALLEQARALLDRLRTRLKEGAALDPRLDGALADRPVPQRVEDGVDRLQTLFGDGFTVLPPFTPSNPDELTATFTDGALVPDGQGMAAETWLQRTAGFRDNVSDFREARSYAEVLSGTLTASLTVGQVPFEPGDTWVGVEGVDPAAGKLSLIAQFEQGLTPATADGRMSGLFVDEYTEGVPADSETTGLAINYDDPGNRPPQSILLATPPEDDWTLDELVATIDETATYMKRRAVDMGDLDDLSSIWPGLYFPQQSSSSPRTTTVPFGMVDWYDVQYVAALLPAEHVVDFQGVLFDE